MDFNKVYESVQEKHFDDWYEDYNTRKLKEEVIQNASEVASVPHERMSKALRCLESFVSDKDWLELRETIVDLENLERKIFHQGFQHALKEDQSKILESYVRIGTFDNKVHLRESYNDIETYNNYKRIKELDLERRSGGTDKLIESLNDYYLKEEIKEMVRSINHLYEAANPDFVNDWKNNKNYENFKNDIEDFILNGEFKKLKDERDNLENNISGKLPTDTKFIIENEKIYYYKEDPVSGIIPYNNIINSKTPNIGILNYVWYKTYDMDDADIPDITELDNEFNATIKPKLQPKNTNQPQPPVSSTTAAPTLSFTSEENFKIDKEVESIPIKELVSTYTIEVIQKSIEKSIEEEKQKDKDAFTNKNAGSMSVKRFNKAQKKEDKRIEQKALKRLTDIEAYGIRRKILEYARSKFNEPTIDADFKRTVTGELEKLEKATSTFARKKAAVMNFIKRRAPLLMRIITFASGAISIGLRFGKITAMFSGLGPLAPIMGLVVSAALFFIQRAIFKLAGKVTDALIEKLFTRFIAEKANGKGPLAWFCKKLTMSGDRAKIVTKTIVKILTTLIIAKPTANMLTGMVGKLAGPMQAGLESLGVTAESVSQIMPDNIEGTMDKINAWAEGKLPVSAVTKPGGAEEAGKEIQTYQNGGNNPNITPEQAKQIAEEASNNPSMIERINRAFADKLNSSKYSGPQDVAEIMKDNPNQAAIIKNLTDNKTLMFDLTETNGDKWTFIRQMDGTYRAFELPGASVPGPGQVIPLETIIQQGGDDADTIIETVAEADPGGAADTVVNTASGQNIPAVQQIQRMIQDLSDGKADSNYAEKYNEWYNAMDTNGKEAVKNGLKNYLISTQHIPADKADSVVDSILSQNGISNGAPAVTDTISEVTTPDITHDPVQQALSAQGLLNSFPGLDRMSATNLANYGIDANEINSAYNAVSQGMSNPDSSKVTHIAAFITRKIQNAASMGYVFNGLKDPATFAATIAGGLKENPAIIGELNSLSFPSR